MATRGSPRVHSPNVEVKVEVEVESTLCVSIRVRPSVRVQGQYEYVQGRYESSRYFQQQSRGSRSRHLRLSSQLSSCFMFSRIPTPQIRAETDGQSPHPIPPDSRLEAHKRTTLPLTATTALFWSFQPPSSAQSPGKNKRGRRVQSVGCRTTIGPSWSDQRTLQVPSAGVAGLEGTLHLIKRDPTTPPHHPVFFLPFFLHLNSHL